MQQLTLCYYPTTAIFLDDHRPFLDSLPLSLNEGILHRAFSLPADAIRHANAAAGLPRLLDEVCSAGVNACDIAQVAARLGNHSRFRELSVLVVDYGMPDMTGLEVCRAIDNPRLKKVLLTGMADERIAREALNDGTIDYYIAKSAGDAFSRINELILEFQAAYFAPTVTEAARAAFPFLDDRAFRQFFTELCRRNDISEYYLHAEPPGFLLVSDGGQLKQLLVCDEATVQQHIEHAERHAAPAELVQRLRARSHIPGVRAGGARQRGAVDEYLFPATAVNGAQTYYCAVLERPVQHEADAAEVFSYRQALGSL